MTHCIESLSMPKSYPFISGDGYVAELERVAQSLVENPDDKKVAILASHVIELAHQNIGHLSSEEADLLQRDIEEITAEVNALSEEESTDAWNAEEAVFAGGAKEAAFHKKHKKKHKGFWKKTAHKVSHASKKVGKFVVKHRKEILIAVALVGVGVGVGLLLGSTAAGTIGGGAAAATAGGASGDIPKGETKGSPKAVPIFKTLLTRAKPVEENVFSRVYDENYILQQEAVKIAEKKAKEQRYPGLAYPQSQVELARSKADAAFDQFKTNLMNSIEPKDVKTVLEISIGTVGAAVAGVATIPMAIVSAGGLSLAGMGVAELVSDAADRVNSLYQPVAQAYTSLHTMEHANRESSLQRCQEVGYTPRLEYSPNQLSSGKTVFVDKNNPDAGMKIIVPLPQ